MCMAVQFNPLPRITPAVTHRFRFHISLHAVERYRNRAAGDLSRFSQLELAARMDDLLFDAFGASRVKEVIDKDAPRETTKVVEVWPKAGEKIHVVMRVHNPAGYMKMNTAGGPDTAALAAITVLTDEMAQASFNGEDGRWFTKPPPRLVTVPPRGEEDGAAYEREEKDEDGGGLGGTRKERSDFVRSLLTKNPKATWLVISDTTKQKFGTGVSYPLIRKIKEEMELEGRVTPVPPKPAPKAEAIVMTIREAPKPPALVQPPAPVVPPPARSTVANIADQFALACEQEKMARARVGEAERELAAAQASLNGASAQASMLLAQLQAQRG